jgi:DNA-binding MarR family transcriptional regulator
MGAPGLSSFAVGRVGMTVVTGDVVPFLHQLLLATQQVVAQGRARAGMTNAEYAALHHLTHHPNGLTPTQLERSLAITSGSVAKLVDRLEARRLARRIRNPSGDRRRVTVQATKRGKDLIAGDLHRLLDHLPDADAVLSHDASRAVARLLTLTADRPSLP